MRHTLWLAIFLWLAPVLALGQDTAAPPATLQRVTGSGDQSTSTPIPDPTKLTTEAVDRLKEQLTTQFNQQIESLTKDLTRLQKELDERPDIELITEKFTGVNNQFIARDNNLGTALSAQKDDAAKTERNFATQISNTQKAIDDLKDRVTRFESASSGAGGAITWVILAISAIAGIMAIAAYFKTPIPVPVPIVHYESGNGRSKTP